MAYQASEGMGNMLRLKGLKNVAGRRRVAGESDYFPELDPVDEDVAGTNEPLTHNPRLENIGNSPQSSDPRANSVNIPDETSIFSRIGKSLGLQGLNADEINPHTYFDSPENKSAVRTPPIETEQVQMAEDLPPETLGEQEVNESFLSKFGNTLRGVIAPEAKALFNGDWIKPEIKEGVKNYANSFKPELGEDFERQFPEVSETLPPPPEEPDVPIEAREQPVYGATDQILNSPDLMEEVNTIAGIDLNSAENQNMIKAYEAILTDQSDEVIRSLGLNEEQINRTKQRIENNEATDSDKYFVGLALLMPLIIGGIFGKEAGLGALEGGAKGFGNVLENRSKNIASDQELLSKLTKERADLGLKKNELDFSKLNSQNEVAKNLPKNPREFLEGRKEFTYTDPKTGEKISGIGIKPGFVAYPENVNNEKDIDRMEKAAQELRPIQNYTQGVTELTDDIIHIANQLKDKTIFGKAFAHGITKKLPGALSKLSQEVEFDGRKVNAGIILDELTGLLANEYARAQKLGQLDAAAQRHIDKIFINPTKTFSSSKDLIDQMIEVRKKVQGSYLNEIKSSGFIPEAAIKELKGKNKNLFGALNDKEGIKTTDRDIAG